MDPRLCISTRAPDRDILASLDVSSFFPDEVEPTWPKKDLFGAADAPAVAAMSEAPVELVLVSVSVSMEAAAAAAAAPAGAAVMSVAAAPMVSPVGRECELVDREGGDAMVEMVLLLGDAMRLRLAPEVGVSFPGIGML